MAKPKTSIKMTAESVAPIVENLQGDTIRTWVGRDPVAIDTGLEAKIISETGKLSYLSINFWNAYLHPNDLLGIKAGAAVETTDITFKKGTKIKVDGTEIGEMAEGSGVQNFDIVFNETADTARVAKLLHAITYQNKSFDAGLVHETYINIFVGDTNGKESHSRTNITLAPENLKILTQAKDAIIGTDDNDVIEARWTDVFVGDEIDAGAGDGDVLLVGGGGEPQDSDFYLSVLGKFKGFEIIRSSAARENIIIRNDQLVGIKEFDGGGGADRLFIEGGDADIGGKVFKNFRTISLWDNEAELTVDSVANAKLFHGDSSYDKLIVDGATLTKQDRLEIHRHGIDEIQINDGAEKGTYINREPSVQRLVGDRVTMAPGQVVHVDAGRDSVLTDDDVYMDFFAVSISSDRDLNDRLGIDTSGMIKTPDGIKANGRIMFGGDVIGTLRDDSSIGISGLRIDLTEKATLAAVNELTRSITYTNASEKLDHSVEVAFAFGDSGSRHTWATVTVDPAEASPTHAPTDIMVGGMSVEENVAIGTVVGNLYAIDPDAGDTFTFSLINNAGGRFALQDNQLVTAGLIDFEQAASYSLTVRATDQTGQSVDKTAILTVRDVFAENVTGTSGDDKIKGGAGKDSLSGGAGNDTLYGGSGNDKLAGGEGADVFVFDTKLGSAKTNKKLNFDMVVGFDKLDKIWLSKSIFKKLGKTGSEDRPVKLNKKLFAFDKAKQPDDYLIYNKETGALSYDADGSKKGAAVQFATVKSKSFDIKMDVFVV